MELSFTEEQQAIGDLARRIFEDHVTRERRREVDADSQRFDRVLWSELARAQLLGAAIPERDGGLGGGMLELCVLLEEAGRAAAPVPLWSSLVVGGLPIGEFGNDAQRARLLPGLASGALVLSGALLEPGSDDPLRPETTARPDRTAWRIEGTKTGVPVAGIADRIVVSARTGEGPALFLIDPAGEGVVLERQTATSGEPQSLLSFSGAAAEALGGGAPGVAWLLDRALTGLCALQAGIAEKALRLTADHVSAREQFGRPLATFQAVQQRIADAYIDVQAMRWTMWQAAWRLDEGLPATEEVAIAKYWAAEGGHCVLAAAQHLHGGLGVDVEYPLHRYTTAAKQIELTLGGATRQLARLGDLIAAGTR